jgi:Mannosyl-glycoprotein endo-beta-N-acetylglucosaminidase
MLSLSRSSSSPRRLGSRIVLAVAVCALALAGCNLAKLPKAPGTVTIMGPSSVTAAQLAAWFHQHSQPSNPYNATVPVEQLAQYFVDEGTAENVRGDVAFVQSVVETGYFRFGGSVPASFNNFSGLGATGSSGAPIARFSSAKNGVRAQIQHLRRYADPTATACSVPPLHKSCQDPRFMLVVPPGKATTWNVMGNGNWATSTTYASTILNLYNDLRAYAQLPRA